ncbi:MAG: hypothetical protein NTV61_06580 [Candidatus Bathyarchaeota archaeon]|nr:hypothetical protein [Candidatus Bathyarchaeota archaeon]
MDYAYNGAATATQMMEKQPSLVAGNMYPATATQTDRKMPYLVAGNPDPATDAEKQNFPKKNDVS